MRLDLGKQVRVNTYVLTNCRATLFSCSMKNVTITLDEKVARWAKVWAAQHDTSVSRILGETLREKMLMENSYESAQRRFLSRTPTALKAKAESYPKRDQIYER